MLSLPARRYFARSGPRAAQLLIPGGVLNLPVSTTPNYIDLRSVFATHPTQTNNSSLSGQINGIVGHRLVLKADVATVGIILGNAATDVSGANAPVLGTQSTISANGIVTPVVGTCWTILPGTTVDFEPANTQDFFLGFVGSATGTLELYQNSLTNA